MLLLLLIPFLFALDFWAKEIIEQQENSFFPKKIARETITLHKSHNHGMMMGFLKKFPLLTKIIPFAVTAILSLSMLPAYLTKGRIFTKLGGVLAISGAVGNLYDRFARGYVVDYFSLPIKKIKHIIFNLSDFYIFIGLLLLFITQLFNKES